MGLLVKNRKLDIQRVIEQAERLAEEQFYDERYNSVNTLLQNRLGIDDNKLALMSWSDILKPYLKPHRQPVTTSSVQPASPLSTPRP